MTQTALGTIRDETLAVLRRHIGTGDRVALLDFPTYDNAGDSLIYAGEAEYLRQLGVEVGYVADLLTYDDSLARSKIGSGTILLRGGGNFGDRWPAHQQFREYVVAQFPKNKIVCLPQGIDYSTSDALNNTAKLYAKHSDLTLMLREHRSLDIALAAFSENKVEYCPDMAFGANIADSPGGSEVDVVKLLRVDSERLDRGDVVTNCSSVQYDWGLHGRDFAVWQTITLPTRIAHNWPKSTRLLYPLIARSYRRTVALNLSVAQRLLNKGPVVLTDRLHAAVLAGMMGKQVIAMDNANKKVSGIYDAYLHRFDNVRFATTATEASEMVARAVSVGD